MKSRIINMEGLRFGRMLVVKRDGSKSGKAMWLCFCDCGNTKTVSGNGLREGRIKSCGCLHDEFHITHGMNKTTTYSSWKHMKNRCNNPNSDAYPYYGGRGIAYDPKWEKFEGFYEDMGERPEGLTLERIDVNGNYCKDNCIWASKSQQGYNRRILKKNKSGKTGVTWNKRLEKWSSQITVNWKKIHLGYFTNLKDAIKIRQDAEIKYFGYVKD